MAQNNKATGNEPQPIPIMDWYDIWAGTVGWGGHGGPSYPQDVPQGVRLALQPAKQTEPFLRRERPWEAYFNYMHVLHDEGRYRFWYSASPDPETVERLGIALVGGGGYPDFTCYAESDDGFHWERPNLGMYNFAGSTDNNIITEGGMSNPQGWHIYQVFKDPTAPPDERYKSNCQAGVWIKDGVRLKAMTKPEIKEMRDQLQLEGLNREEIGRRLTMQFQVLGFVSPDGIHWRRLPEAILEPPGRLDMRNMVFCDEEKREYVAYLRGHTGRRRTLRRSVSKAFAHGWQNPPQEVFAPDSQDPPYVDFYDFGYCRQPGSPYHLMFFSLYNRATDTMDIHLAVSRNGFVWTRPERRAIITNEIPGGSGEHYAVIYPSPGLIPLGDDWWGQAYFAHTHCHWEFDYEKWAFYEPSGAYHWGMWKRDRLVGLEAPMEGRVAMLERQCAGQQLLLNYKTGRGGWIKAELCGTIGSLQPTRVAPFEGFTFDESDFLTGDSLSAPVAWRGRTDLSSLKGRPVSVRLHIFNATLFSVAI